MDADSFRRLARRLALIAAVLLILPWLGVGLAALGAAHAYFEPSLQERARLLGQSVGQRFERALGFGLNLRDLNGVADYLDSVRGDQDDLAYLALLDADGRDVAHSGDPARAATDLRTPIQHHGRVVGHVQVGLDVDTLNRLRGDGYSRLAFALICALALVFETTRFILDRRLTAPARAAQDLADAAAAQRFDRVAAWRGEDALAAYATALSRMIRHVARRRRETGALVEDLRDAHLSDAAVARADAALTAAESGRRFVDALLERPAPTPAGFRRFAVFWVALLLGLAAPFVQHVVALGPEAAIWVAAPLATLASLTGRTLDPLARRLGPRATILLGAALAATAFMWVGELDGVRQALVSAAIGVGIGLMLHACGDIYGLSAAEDYGDAQQGVWSGALAGAVAGVAFSALMDDAADLTAARVAVSVGFLCVGALLATARPDHPLSARPEIWLNGVEIASLCARPRILLFATQVLAPLGAALWVFIALAPAASGDLSAAAVPPAMMLFAAALGGLVAIQLAGPLARTPTLAAWSLAATMLAGGATLYFTPFDGSWVSLGFNAANGFFFAFGGPLQSRLRAELAHSERGRLGEKRVSLFFRMVDGVSCPLGLAAALALSFALGVTGATRGMGLALVAAGIAFVVGWLTLPNRAAPTTEPGDAAP